MTRVRAEPAGDCPVPLDGRAHDWKPGDAVALRSWGRTGRDEADAEVCVCFGRCGRCGLPLLALARWDEDVTAGQAFAPGAMLEVSGAQLW